MTVAQLKKQPCDKITIKIISEHENNEKIKKSNKS